MGFRGDVPGIVENLNELTDLEGWRAVHRDIDVDFEVSRFVDGSQQGRDGHSIADAHRNIADDPVGGRHHAVVMQCDLSFIELGLERVLLFLRGGQVGLRLVEFLLGDHARFGQLLGAVELDLGELDVGLLRCDRRLLALHRGLLPQWIDFHQFGPGRDAVARLHQNAGDLPFDLGIERGGMPRFQGGQKFRVVGNGDVAHHHRLHRCGGNVWILTGLVAAATGDRYAPARWRPAPEGFQRGELASRRPTENAPVRELGECEAH